MVHDFVPARVPALTSLSDRLLAGIVNPFLFKLILVIVFYYRNKKLTKGGCGGTKL